MIHVFTRLWVDARKQAATIAGCSPDSILCVKDTEEAAEERKEQAGNQPFKRRREKDKERLIAWQSGQSAR